MSTPVAEVGGKGRDPWPVKPLSSVADSTDYVANGSFATLAANVTYRSEPDYAVLVRFTDFAKGWKRAFVYVDEPSFRFLRKSVLSPGDVVVSNVGEPGRVFRVPDLGRPMTLGPNAVLIRPGVEIDKGFLAYFLSSPKGQTMFASITTGTAQKKFNKTSLRRLEVPVPALSEQLQVVSEIDKQFTRLDAGVAALRRVQANLRRYSAAVLKAACEGRLVPTEAELARKEGRTFETGADLLERTLRERRGNWKGRGQYKEPASSGVAAAALPEGWALATLAQLSFLDVGFAFKSAEFQKSGIRLLRGENIEPGKMRWSDTRYWPESRLREFQHLLIREGEIILAMDRPLISTGLKIARARADDLPCLLVQRVARFRPVFEPLAAYLFAALNTHEFTRHLLGGQTGTQLPHISGEGIQSFAIPLPPLAEQARIVAEAERRLSVMDELEAVVSTNLQRATRLRQSVLQGAFSGGR